MRTSMTAATLAICLLSTASAQDADDLGAPVAMAAPSINSATPGTIEAGSGTTTITIFGVGIAVPGATTEALWNGESLGAANADDDHPGTRLRIDVPADRLASPGAATLSLVLAGVETNAVTITLGADPPPECPDPSDPRFTVDSKAQICGYALGAMPTLEMVPRHAWYPFLAAPAGGIIRIMNRDTQAEFGNHAVTNTTVQDQTPFVSDIAPSGIKGRYFDLSVVKPSGSTPLEGVEGFLRVPEHLGPGDSVPFFCSTHSNDMVTPLGGITVQ